MFRTFRQVFRGFACLLAWGLLSPAIGQTITLKSADGAVTLQGELLDFDGEFYKIDTKFGEMTLNALGVICTGAACPDPGQYAADISIAVSRNLSHALLPGLIEQFAFRSGLQAFREDNGEGWTYFLADKARIPVARIQKIDGNSRAAFTALAKETADLALTNRPPLASEKSEAALKIDPRHQIFLALDALVFIVAPGNPVSALSLDQIRQIYAGEITNWAELGGDDAPIALYGQATGSERMARFSAMTETDGEATGDATTAQVILSDEAIADAVANDPFAIGYTGIGFTRNAKRLAISSDCGIRQYPDRFGVKTGDYPLAHAVYLYRPARRLPVLLRDFLGWLSSDPAQFAIDESGLVSQAIEAMPIRRQQYRISNAIAEADNDVPLDELKRFTTIFTDASRLSVTFRFLDGSINMDARSNRNLRRMALALEQGEFKGRTLIIAGFSDSQGGGGGNRTISLQRAEKVARMLREAASRADLGAVKFRVVALGEVAPLACNDTDTGRSTNRRVEIWVE